MPNCSATTSEEWFGSMTPPEPTRMVRVASAIWPMRTGGEELATPGMPWCSATQNLVKPSSSVLFASAMVARSASPAVEPSGTGARSSTPSGTPARVRGRFASARGNSVGHDLAPTSAGGAFFRPGSSPGDKTFIDRSFGCNGVVAEFERRMAILGS